MRAQAPFHVMLKPIGAQCNLRCDYCFYLEKAALFPERRGAALRMTEATLESVVHQIIEARAPGQDEVVFAWQGGEPTLMGLPFFEKAIALQSRYAPPGVRIANTFQTNGVLVDENFARFFREHGFLVGVSIDGPEALHDRFRRDAAGRGSFSRVMAGIEAMSRHGVEYNLMTSVQRHNASHPEDVYDFLIGLGSPFIQFIPIVEPDPEHTVSERSLTGESWGEFLTRVFHRWRKYDVGRVFVQHFDMALGVHLGHPASLCVHAPQCGRGLALEHNGDLFSCDHFVDADHRLGNLLHENLAQLADGHRQQEFGAEKSRFLPDACRQCPHLHLCHGGCPKDRLLPTASGRLNWLCSGYARFFEESRPYFLAMISALNRGLPAAEFDRFLPADPISVDHRSHGEDDATRRSSIG
ncbi:anaerobic sulfatase maturase [Propionivibrio soli]|uniref:anaerobic sulfatase maturase n=1 Tax=Propionivibrio soli TaxID=2976531 RepID=UPI0021E7AFC7|nr:anaerobic sulfatase maturase [Propionivibrio soli]